VEENTINPTVASERTHSDLQERFLEVSRKIDSLVGLRSNIVSAVGAWADGAENTTMTTYEGTTFDQISVSAAMKGLIGNQKNVIAFQSSARGASRMFSLSLPERDPAKLNEFLVRNGVEFHTLVPTENGTDVHIFTKDVNRTLSHSVSKLAKGQGVAVKKYKGKGDFLGDENWSSREDARKSYEKTIDDFLKNKPAKRRMWEQLKADYGV
jgi:hypothetical protein